MKKINYLVSIVIMILISISLNAQDKIFLKSGDNIEAKILEINIDEVKYKKFSNQEGPTYTILKSDIHMIVFENGESQIFKTNKPTNKVTEETFSNNNSYGFNRNRINIEFIGIADLGPASVSYEKLNESGNMGLEIPFNLHYDSSGIVGYTTGINFKFYPNGGGEWFFIGPSIALGVFEYYYYSGGGYYKEDTTFTVVPGAKLGVQFQITDVFGLSLSGTAGYVLPIDGDVDGEFAYSANFGFNFSFGH